VRKLAIVVLLLLSLAAVLLSAALVPSTAWTAQATGIGTPTTSSAITSTGGSLIVCSDGYWGAIDNSLCTDSKTNTYTALTARADAAVNTNKLSYAQNPTVGTSHTFTLTSPTNNAYPSGCGGVFSGMKLASVFIAQNGASNNSGSTLQPGNLATAVGNLVVAITGSAAGVGGAAEFMFRKTGTAAYSVYRVA